MDSISGNLGYIIIQSIWIVEITTALFFTSDMKSPSTNILYVCIQAKTILIMGNTLMLRRKTKAAFYKVAGPLMKCNGWLYCYLRAPNGEPCKVHLGPGQQKYIPGWINLDANMFTGKCDVWVDLRNPLPFWPSTIDALYSHHVVEHLPDLKFHFREAYRCLKPGGVYRIGVPHGDSAIKKFIEGDKEWFGDFPDSRRSIGGRLENFIFCRQEHTTILTYSYLDELMTDAGFINIQNYLPVRETGFPEIFGLCLEKEYEDNYDCPHTLIVEAQK